MDGRQWRPRLLEVVLVVAVEKGLCPAARWPEPYRYEGSEDASKGHYLVERAVSRTASSAPVVCSHGCRLQVALPLVRSGPRQLAAQALQAQMQQVALQVLA